MKGADRFGSFGEFVLLPLGVVFALVVLLTLTIAAVAAWAGLGMLPGYIARQRKHPRRHGEGGFSVVASAAGAAVSAVVSTLAGSSLAGVSAVVSDGGALDSVAGAAFGSVGSEPAASG